MICFILNIEASGELFVDYVVNNALLRLYTESGDEASFTDGLRQLFAPFFSEIVRSYLDKADAEIRNYGGVSGFAGMKRISTPRSSVPWSGSSAREGSSCHSRSVTGRLASLTRAAASPRFSTGLTRGSISARPCSSARTSSPSQERLPQG